MPRKSQLQTVRDPGPRDNQPDLTSVGRDWRQGLVRLVRDRPVRAGVALARWLFLVFLASYLTLLLLGHLSDSPLLDGIDPTFLLLTALGLGIVVVFLAEET